MAESKTTAVFKGLQPPALVHLKVLSFGCFSGVLPGVWAMARLIRAARTILENAIVSKKVSCNYLLRELGSCFDLYSLPVDTAQLS